MHFAAAVPYQTMRHEGGAQTQGATGKTAVGKRRDLCAKLGKALCLRLPRRAIAISVNFPFGDEEKDGDLALGMRKRMSYYEVVTLKDCNIVDADYLRIIEGTLQFFQERKVPFLS